MTDILRGNRKRALSLTHWDYSHEKRVKDALAWLDKLAAQHSAQEK